MIMGCCWVLIGTKRLLHVRIKDLKQLLKCKIKLQLQLHQCSIIITSKHQKEDEEMFKRIKTDASLQVRQRENQTLSFQLSAFKYLFTFLPTLHIHQNCVCVCVCGQTCQSLNEISTINITSPHFSVKTESHPVSHPGRWKAMKELIFWASRRAENNYLYLFIFSCSR